MRIVILTAADSLPSKDFSTMLSHKGFNQADKLVSILHSINPDVIYASPFLRSLQTIYPFCNSYKRKLNAECSLYPLERFDAKESYINPAISEHYNFFSYIFDIVDDRYHTRVFPNNILRNETSRDIGNRIFPFLYDIKKQYSKSDKTILLVTHADICPYMLDYLNVHHGDVIDGSLYLLNYPLNHRHDRKHTAVSKLLLQ